MKKIIILGAGQVGYSLAAQLALEDNDITVIDLNPKRLKLLADRFDLRTVVGNAAHPSVLQEAGIEDCELLIAVTEVDEINMLACRIAHMLFNVPDRVARIRAVEYFRNEHLSDGTLFDINHMICPEQVVTDYLLKLMPYVRVMMACWWAGPFLNCLIICPTRMHALWRSFVRMVRCVQMAKRSYARAMKSLFYLSGMTCAKSCSSYAKWIGL